MRRWICLLGSLVVSAGMSSAEPVTDDSSRSPAQDALLSVQSNVAGVKVFVDTLLLGETPVEDARVTAGEHILHFVHPDSKNWLLPAIVETLVVAPSDHIVRTATFPTVYHIISNPYGAEVYYNDSVIGQTPLIFAAVTERGVVTLRHGGYDDQILPLPDGGGLLHATLPSRIGEAPSPLLNGEEVKSLTPVYLATGTAIFSGALAAYFKIKADGYYNDYKKSGDTGALDRVRRLDTLSGVTLLTSEVSLFVLSYLLLSR
ncbi:MAG TPA: PEGA domain-containing protein [Bacteroidota bacterium]|jgi:hypothetical protein|nr:PEGA domain-containing protein [Bacteroidota bacterium]